MAEEQTQTRTIFNMSTRHYTARIKEIEPLIPPSALAQILPISKRSQQNVLKSRLEASNIIKGIDDRLLVICGPCSIHNV